MPLPRILAVIAALFLGGVVVTGCGPVGRWTHSDFSDAAVRRSVDATRGNWAEALPAVGAWPRP